VLNVPVLRVVNERALPVPALDNASYVASAAVSKSYRVVVDKTIIAYLSPDAGSALNALGQIDGGEHAVPRRAPVCCPTDACALRPGIVTLLSDASEVDSLVVGTVAAGANDTVAPITFGARGTEATDKRSAYFGTSSAVGAATTALRALLPTNRPPRAAHVQLDARGRALARA
jgi:hypothetical protein